MNHMNPLTEAARAAVAEAAAVAAITCVAIARGHADNVRASYDAIRANLARAVDDVEAYGAAGYDVSDLNVHVLDYDRMAYAAEAVAIAADAAYDRARAYYEAVHSEEMAAARALAQASWSS